MAWTGPIESKEFSSPTGSGTTYTFSPTSTIPVGTLIIIGWSGSVNSVVDATCSDNSTQAGTANSYTILGVQTTTGPSIAGSLIYCDPTTRSILSTDVITVTTAASTRRNAKLLTFTGQDPAGSFDVSADEAASSTSPYAIGPTAALSSTNELVVGFASIQTTSAPTITDGTTGYTVVAGSGSGGTAIQQYAVLSYKTTAGTTAETDTQTYGTGFSRAVGQIAAFTQAPATTGWAAFV